MRLVVVVGHTSLLASLCSVWAYGYIIYFIVIYVSYLSYVSYEEWICRV